jgi:hypothetical protein
LFGEHPVAVDRSHEFVVGLFKDCDDASSSVGFVEVY